MWIKAANLHGSTQTMGKSEVAARSTFLVAPQGVIRREFLKVTDVEPYPP
jgi:peroxiredoxin